MKQTHHSQRRRRQRCIPPLISDWFEIYGEVKNAPGGASIRYFSKYSKKMIRDDVGNIFYKRIKSLLDTYEIVIGGRVITTGRRLRRIK